MNTDTLTYLGACSDARQWCATQPDERTAWETCERGDWLLWLLRAIPIDLSDREWRLLACDFAEDAVQFVRDEWVQSVCEGAIEVARRFAVGEASDEERRAAATATAAAAAAATAADYAAAAAAATAADYAEFAATATAAAAAATAADYAAADYAADRSRLRARQADMIRAVVPWSRVRAALRNVGAPKEQP